MLESTQKNNRRRWLAPLLLAPGWLVARWCFALCALWPDAPHSWPLWPAALALATGWFCFFNVTERRARRLACLFSIPCALAQLIGRQYDASRTLGGPMIALQCLGCALFLGLALAGPLAALLRALARRETTEPSSARSEWGMTALCVLALMLMWQPVHMAYYPGLGEYDSGYQLWQSWNHSYDASNPLLHTFILGRFYLIGEQIATATIGISAFCVVQRLFMAGCVSYALRVVRRAGAPRGWMIASLLFFGLLPVFPMMAISCTKDVPYYAATLAQLAMIFDGLRGNRRRFYWPRLILITAFAALMRANALPFMFLLAPLCFPLWRERPLRKRFIAAITAGVALAWGVNAALIAINHAARPVLRESLSVPIIQLARVSDTHEEAAADFSENHADMIAMPLAYIPYVADLAKWSFEVDASNIGEFAALWAKYLARFPGDYLDALLMVNRGYWYVADTTFARVYGDAPELRTGVIPSRVSQNIATIIENSRLPALKAHLERLYSGNAYLNIPIYRRLLSPALYVWTILFALIAAIYRERHDIHLIARHAVLLLVALLLGPCCILRYALLFMMLAPIMLGMLLTTSPNNHKEYSF